jgi:hypothetical protein
VIESLADELFDRGIAFFPGGRPVSEEVCDHRRFFHLTVVFDLPYGPRLLRLRRFLDAD